jgi:alpha-galactosidase
MSLTPAALLHPGPKRANAMPTRHPGPLAASLAAASLLLVRQPGCGFIDTFRPQTLGAACERAQTITVMRVKKFSKERATVLFEKVKDLKGKYPRPGLRERLGSAHLPAEKRHYLDWVGEGKTAVVFRYENRQAVCVGDQWTVCDAVPPKDGRAPWDVTTRTEPWFLQTYCGDADELVAAVTNILAGKEVVVPCMVGRRDKELRERTGKLVRMWTSLKLKTYDLKNTVDGEPGSKDKPARARAAPAVARPTVDTPLPTPGMGWTTFNFFVARHGDKLMRQMGDAFVASGLRDAGYTILRIDGGWWGDDGNRRWYYWTTAGKYAGGPGYRPGDPHVDPKNYPGGIKPLADHLHRKGLKLDFYLAPELSTGSSDNYPGNKVRKEQPPVKGLRLVDQHARWVADNGIDHVFYDGYDWSRGKGIEPYTRMFTGLRKEAKRVKRPIVFSINSGWHARPREWADEWRTSPDINGQWKSILENLATVADPKPAGKGRWNNPDCLMVGFCGDEEARSQMSLWCVAGAPLYVSSDFRVMNAWERYVLLNTEAIAVDQDPAGTPGRRVRWDGSAQVWARSLADGSKAVVLLNAGDRPLSVRVRWAELGLKPGPVQVRDLWAHKDLGMLKGEYTAKDLPPRGCAFLKVAAGEKPLPEPKPTWAPHPGKRPDFRPLPTKGWTLRTDLGRKDDPPGNLADSDPKTGFWSGAEPGKRIELDLGKVVRLDRLVIDHKGVGPNPWPYKVYARRSTFTLEVSEDGKTFRKVAADSFGPAYTIVTFKPRKARHVRLVLDQVERMSAYGDRVWGAKDIYLFDTGVPPR